MNLGRAYEAYLWAVSSKNKQNLIKDFTNKYGNEFIGKINQENLNYFYNFISGLYSLINSDMLEFIESLNSKELFNYIK